MNFTNERLYPENIPYEIRFVLYEHFARYKFACGFVRDKVVLDAACGSGYGSLLLAQEGKAEKVIGVDINHEAIREARKKCSLNNVFYKIADVTRLNAFAEIFDVVVSFETIEHLTDGKKLINEAYRVLKKGGIFIVSTPNRLVSSPKRPMDRPIHPHHHFEYTREEFINDLKTCFKIQNMYGQSMKRLGLVNLYITLVENRFTRKLMLLLLNLRFKFYRIIFSLNLRCFENAIKNYWENKTRVKPLQKGKEEFYMVAVCRKI